MKANSLALSDLNIVILASNRVAIRAAIWAKSNGLALFGPIFRGCIRLGKLMTFMELQSQGALDYNF